MPQDDAVNSIAERARRIAKTMENVVAAQRRLPPGEVLPTQTIACETCGETFASKRALAVHQRDYRCFWRERAAAAYRQSVADSHFADSLDEYVANVLARPA